MVSINDIKPRMKVQLVSHHENTFQRKREWLGKTVTVKDIFPNGRKYRDGNGNDGRPCFNVVEDRERFEWGMGWSWFEDHIECIIEDPENQPIDTSAFDSLII